MEYLNIPEYIDWYWNLHNNQRNSINHIICYGIKISNTPTLNLSQTDIQSLLSSPTNSFVDETTTF